MGETILIGDPDILTVDFLCHGVGLSCMVYCADSDPTFFSGWYSESVYMYQGSHSRQFDIIETVPRLFRDQVFWLPVAAIAATAVIS